MNAYTTFAQVYDLFMDNVPYEEWSNYIVSVLKEYGIHSGVICDLGCGTGKMTRLLAKAGLVLCLLLASSTRSLDVMANARIWLFAAVALTI